MHILSDIFFPSHFFYYTCTYIKYEFLTSVNFPSLGIVMRFELHIKNSWARAGVAQWIEHRPVNQRVAGSIPSQGTCLGCGPGPQLGAREGQPHIDVSLLLFLLPSPSL